MIGLSPGRMSSWARFQPAKVLKTGSPGVAQGSGRLRAAKVRRAEALPGWWGDRDDPLVYVTFGSVAAGLGLFPRFYGDVLEWLRTRRFTSTSEEAA